MKKEKSVIWFMFAYTVYMTASAFVHPVTPTLIKDRQLSDYMFGVAMASMMTANFLFSPFWGKLCNYISTKYIMFVCCCGYTLAQAYFCLSMTELDVAAARFFAGIFLGGAGTSSLNYIINVSSDEKRPVNLTIIATIQSVGPAAG